MNLGPDLGRIPRPARIANGLSSTLGRNYPSAAPVTILRWCGGFGGSLLASRLWSVGVVSIAIVHSGGASKAEIRAWLDHWSVAEWAVAIGTLALAFFTYRVAQRAQGQIEFQRQEVLAAARPIIYPAGTNEWIQSGQRKRYVLIRNGGLGPAISVEGEIEWSAPGASPRPLTAIWQSGGLGPGEERLNFLARPGIQNWHDARGVLIATGVDRRRWRTDFSSQIEEGDVVVLRVSGITEIGPNDPTSLS